MAPGSSIAAHYSDDAIRELRVTVDKHANDALGKQALESLGAIRDDRALRHIHAIATRGKGKLGKRAAQILGDVSRQRGLSLGDLEDLIVPDLGLDEHGSMTLDYGPRRFTVGFDEQLEPFVRDEGGNRLATLPRVTASDDEAKATRAAAAWKQLKSDVKVIGREQTHRLERAMCTERKWTGVTLGTHLVSHRLLGHLARRLVFATPLPTGVQTFRVAQDGSYDDGERAMALSPEARVVIAHPAMLDEATRARWRQTFIDYEILQPFAQLDRPLVYVPEADLHTSRTSLFAGRKVHAKTFWGLKARGWVAGYEVTKQLGAHFQAKLEITPHLEYGEPMDSEHVVGSLSVVGATFDELSPIMRTELLRDVDLLK